MDSSSHDTHTPNSSSTPDTHHSESEEHHETNGVIDSAGEAQVDKSEPVEQEIERIFQLKVNLPREPKSIQIQVSTHEQMQDVRQSIIELPETLQYSCFHLEHNGSRLNDHIELSEVKTINEDPQLSLVEDPYTEKDARLHVVRVRELIGSTGDRTDVVQGLNAGASWFEHVGSPKEDDKTVHPLSTFELDTSGALSDLPNPPIPDNPKAVKALALSPWNPPPYSFRSKGHLIYLQVTTNEGEQHQITSHIGGFYVNRSTHSKFDPYPRPPPKNFSAHSLLVLLDQISPSFSNIFQTIQQSSISKDPLSIFRFTNAIPASPWAVPANHVSANLHQADPARSQENYLLSGADDAETLRDWNEEFQTTRELPKETIQEKIFRERLTSKLFADYTEAAARGAVLIVRGEVVPLNPTEDQKAQIFVYNNIFFSYGADGVGTFASEGGDPAARAATGRDISGVRVVNQLDINGLFTPGTVIVDYMGKRVVCQSLIPGIFKQREPEEHQIDYGAVDGKDVIACDKEFVTPFKTLSDFLQIKPHDVWDKEGKKYFLEGSVETKGLKGTDGRKYVLDLYRLTPLDVCWIEENWKEVTAENKATSDKQVSESKIGYPHRMTSLRMELVQDLCKMKAIEYAASHRGKKPVKQISAEDHDGDKSNEAINGDSTGEAVEEKNGDMNDFKYALNGDIFTGQNPQTEEEISAWAKDEADVREACLFLRDTVIPRLIHDLREAEVGFPMDGVSLSRLMHKRGINMRYLGKIANLSSDNGSRLAALKDLCVHEMAARSFKHISGRYLSSIPTYLMSSCISHLLNCFLGASLNPDPKADIDETLRFSDQSCKYEFEEVTPESLQTEMQSEICRRYAFEVDEKWLATIRPVQLLREIAMKIGLQLEVKDYVFSKDSAAASASASVHVNGSAPESSQPLGRAVNGKKKKKGSDRGSPASSTVSIPLKAPTTFSPEDVLNMLPVVKDAAPKSTLAEEAFEAGRASLSHNEKELGQDLILESQSLHEQIYGILHPEIARFYMNLSMLYYQMDEKAAAVEIARKAVIVAERALGVDSAETILSYLNLGLYEHASGNTLQALSFVRHALEMTKIIYGPKHPDSITNTNNVAVMLQHLKFYHDSRLWFEMSLTISEELFGKDSENSATLLFQLAQALVLDGDSKGSVSRIRDAYNIFLAKFGPDDRNTKEAESWLEKLTQNAVSVAKNAKELQNRKLRRVQFNPRVAFRTRTQPWAEGTAPLGDPASSSGSTGSAIGSNANGSGLDSRNIEELTKFIEGGEASKRQLLKKKSTRSNPKRRGGATLTANA